MDTGIAFVLLGLLLAALMYVYEICRYALVVEMVERKRWTARNWRTLIFGAALATGAFVLAVAFAQAILRAWGG